MEVIEFENKEKWNEFLAGNKQAQFCQSFEWGEFQKSLGRRIWRLAVLVDDKILGVCLLIKMKLPFNKFYFYSPRGPVLPVVKLETVIKCLIEKIKELAKQEKAIFWRFEPITGFKIQNSKFRIQKNRDVQPSQTLVLNLEKSRDQLLSEMHPKTRYNIKLAEKRGIKISYSYDSIEIKNFLLLLKETSLRDKFKPHPDFYYQKMFEVLGAKDVEKQFEGVRYLSNEIYEKCFLKLIKAKYQNKVLAANILMYFGDTVTYLHGASTAEKKNLMAPFLLQWQAILDAKEAGYQYYDFWGIDEQKWPGVTRFKKSFAGQVVKYPGTFDLIFDEFWFRLYSLGKKFL
jgi:lipid II:glycine glycyltransferase (peptidoglycan interpeptide bridge formation enzyme)